MKKILSVIFCMLFMGSVTACSNDNTEKVSTVIDDYFTLIQEGNYTDAMYLCLDDVDDKFGLKDLIAVIDDGLVKDNPDTFTKEAGDWITHTVSKTVKEYKIIDCVANDDAYVVYVKGKALDFKDLDLKLQDDLVNKMDQFISKNTSKFQKIISNETDENKAVEKINAELSKFIFNEMKDIVDNTNYIDFAMKFTLKEIKGQLKIVDINDSVLSNE